MTTYTKSSALLFKTNQTKLKAMEKAIKMFVDWYFDKFKDIIPQMKEELIEKGSSNWDIVELIEICGDIPEDIAQALKYSGYIDDEMSNHQADMEAQDSELFGNKKI